LFTSKLVRFRTPLAPDRTELREAPSLNPKGAADLRKLHLGTVKPKRNLRGSTEAHVRPASAISPPAELRPPVAHDDVLLAFNA
jgi:hypothetical protein